MCVMASRIMGRPVRIPTWLLELLACPRGAELCLQQRSSTLPTVAGTGELVRMPDHAGADLHRCHQRCWDLECQPLVSLACHGVRWNPRSWARAARRLRHTAHGKRGSNSRLYHPAETPADAAPADACSHFGTPVFACDAKHARPRSHVLHRKTAARLLRQRGDLHQPLAPAL